MTVSATTSRRTRAGKARWRGPKIMTGPLDARSVGARRAVRRVPAQTHGSSGGLEHAMRTDWPSLVGPRVGAPGNEVRAMPGFRSARHGSCLCPFILEVSYSLRRESLVQNPNLWSSSCKVRRVVMRCACSTTRVAGTGVYAEVGRCRPYLRGRDVAKACSLPI